MKEGVLAEGKTPVKTISRNLPTDRQPRRQLPLVVGVHERFGYPHAAEHIPRYCRIHLFDAPGSHNIQAAFRCPGIQRR